MQQNIGNQVKLPTGYFVTYGGQFESQQAATRKIALLALLSLAGMILVLYSHFNSMTIVTRFWYYPPRHDWSVAAIYLTGGGAVGCNVGWLHYAYRHRVAQHHHDDLALSPLA